MRQRPSLRFAFVLKWLSAFTLMVTFAHGGRLPVHAQEPLSFPYDLGETTIVQNQYAEDSRFRNMPVALRGVVAVPEGDGPFPVALVLHGAYTFCTARVEGDDEVDVYPCPPENDLRQYMGFRYLAEALAARGYIALVPDLSAEFNSGFGFSEFSVRSNHILQAQVQALYDGHDFGVGLSSHVDKEHMLIAGHSRGGPMALSFINAVDYPIDAVVLLTPAFLPDVAPVQKNLPVAVVMAACDGDVGTAEPLSYFDAQIRLDRPALTTLYTMPAATHNAFSSQLGADFGQRCAEADIRNPQDQRDFAAQFVPDFFGMALAYSAMPTE